MSSYGRVRALHERSFGQPAELVCRAPGRLEVLGNHTDYNEGHVLGMALEQATWVAAGSRRDGRIGLRSAEHGATVVVPEFAPDPSAPRWTRYPLGVGRALSDQGHSIEPCSLAFEGDLPAEVGLASSAALTVATALALCALHHLALEPVELAQICQQAEHQAVGVACGLLDPLVSLWAAPQRLLHIDFRSLDHELLPMPAAPPCFAILDCGLPRQLRASAYNARRGECAQAAAWFARKGHPVQSLRDVDRAMLERARGELDPRLLARAEHVVTENERVLQAKQLWPRGELERFGALLNQSHQSSQQRFENSCDELDRLVGFAQNFDGVFGARLTGGGFGGAALAMLSPSRRRAFRDAVRARFGPHTRLWFTQPGSGAAVVDR